jgi:hypothetical protein
MLNEIARLISGLCTLAFVAYLGWVVTTTSSFKSCIESKTATETQQANKDSPPNFSTLIKSADIYARCGGSFVYEFRDAATAVATVLIAIFTFTLWQSTSRLWRAGERHSERELRAYILATKPKITQLEVGKRIEIDAPYKNFGQTPAYDVIAESWLDILAMPIAKRHRFNKPRNPRMVEIKATIAPTDGFAVKVISSATFAVTQEIIDVVKAAEKSKIYLYGTITYKDVFKKKRITDFCWRFDDIAFSSGEISLSEQHNRTT